MNPTTAPSVRTPPIESRLPRVGTTIFTVMSALATEHGAVNLGQGFPDFDCDPRLVEAVGEAMRRGLWEAPGEHRERIEEHLLALERRLEEYGEGPLA